LQLHIDCITALEKNVVYVNKGLCEPNLGKRGLYPTTSTLQNKQYSRDLIDFMVYCDGRRSLLDIAIIINKPINYVLRIVDDLQNNKLVQENNKY